MEKTTIPAPKKFLIYAHCTIYKLDLRTWEKWGDRVGEGYEHGVPVAVPGELVVRGQSDDAAAGRAQGEDHLSGGIHPHTHIRQPWPVWADYRYRLEFIINKGDTVELHLMKLHLAWGNTAHPGLPRAVWVPWPPEWSAPGRGTGRWSRKPSQYFITD